MVAQNVFFGIMALVMIFAALKVVSTKNVVHAALWLVVVLGGVAGQFLLLGAEYWYNTSARIYRRCSCSLTIWSDANKSQLGRRSRPQHA